MAENTPIRIAVKKATKKERPNGTSITFHQGQEIKPKHFKVMNITIKILLKILPRSELFFVFICLFSSHNHIDNYPLYICPTYLLGHQIRLHNNILCRFPFVGHLHNFLTKYPVKLQKKCSESY